MPRMGYSVSLEAFEDLVRAALDTIPAPLRERMEQDNLMIVVEPNQDPLAPNPRVLGYFRTAHEFPKRIVILQRHIESFSATAEELAARVEDTVLHEVAHYFGLTHDDIARSRLSH